MPSQCPRLPCAYRWKCRYRQKTYSIHVYNRKNVNGSDWHRLAPSTLESRTRQCSVRYTGVTRKRGEASLPHLEPNYLDMKTDSPIHSFFFFSLSLSFFLLYNRRHLHTMAQVDSSNDVQHKSRTFYPTSQPILIHVTSYGTSKT